MERVQVKSSNIKSIGHCNQTCVAEVEFKNGKVFQYQGVTAEEFNRLANADSVGSNFAKHIKSKQCSCVS